MLGHQNLERDAHKTKLNNKEHEMADIAKTAGDIRPLTGAVTRRGVLGGVATPGDAVYLDGANGWKKADADGEASAQARGVVVSNGNGSTSFASGETVDIVMEGPVEGYAAMTPGGAAFVSTTAGALDQTAPATTGDFPFVVGFAETATVLYVRPQMTVPVAN
jgi:hypothetical protein